VDNSKSKFYQDGSVKGVVPSVFCRQGNEHSGVAKARW